MSLNIIYSFREGLKGLKRVRMATFLTISTIAVTHILLGIFLLFTVNVHRLVDVFKNRVTMEVFIDNSLSDAEQKSLGDKISAIPGIESVIYVSKEEALKTFAKETGIDPVSILGSNPLPSSFRIKITNSNLTPDKIEALKQSVAALDGVDDVVYNSTLFKAVIKNSRRVLIVDGFLFGLVMLSSVLLVANTLRLSIFSQRKSIQIMELVGATRGFIRRPYLIQGVIQGLSGGLFGSGAILLCIGLINSHFMHLLSASAFVVIFPALLGMILGYAGSSIAMKKFLL
ncbi:ABC transporter permease [bacterium]|nr:ABC transporter permease [bacterium]